MTRRCGSSQPIPTPLRCEATKPQGKCYSRKPPTKNGRDEKLYRTLQLMAVSTCARAVPPQISEENGGREKRKRALCKKIETKTKCESAGVEGGRAKNLASKTLRGRKNVPERATYETQLARAEWTSCPTLRGRRRNRAENYQENPPRKTE